MTLATASTITHAPFSPSLATSDMDRAKAWYADKLGWQPAREMGEALVYKVGASSFSVYQSEFAGTAKNTVMNYTVTDVQATVDALRGRGVAFEDYDFGEIKTVDGIMTDPDGGKSAWFKDADGNIVGVIEDASVGAAGGISGMIAAADVARAKSWYADKLGFQPVQASEGSILDYRSGGTRFNVYKTDFAGTAKNTVGDWRISNLKAEVERLRGRGVVFEEYDFAEWGKTVDGIMADPDGNAIAWFKDSEGNILSIAEDAK